MVNVVPVRDTSRKESPGEGVSRGLAPGVHSPKLFWKPIEARLFNNDLLGRVLNGAL